MKTRRRAVRERKDFNRLRRRAPRVRIYDYVFAAIHVNGVRLVGRSNWMIDECTHRGETTDEDANDTNHAQHSRRARHHG